MSTDTAATEAPVRLGPEMTISQAAAWRDTLVDALCATAGDLRLDLSAVTDIDSAGLQLLLATRRSVVERGAALQVTAVSATVRDALAVFGLDSRLEAVANAPGANA